MINKKHLFTVLGGAVFAIFGAVVCPVDVWAATTGTNFITVGGHSCDWSWCEDNVDGFSFNYNDQVITLNNYNGDPIQARIANAGDFKIYLKGNNTINMSKWRYGLSLPDAWYKHTRIAGYTVTIDGDVGATLNIVNDPSISTYSNIYEDDEFSGQLMGIFSSESLKITDNVKINVDIVANSSTNTVDSAYGIMTANVLFAYNSNTKIKVSTDNEKDAVDLYGIKNRLLYLDETSNVDIDIAEHAGDSVPLNTSLAKYHTKNTLTNIDYDYATFTAREKDDAIFSAWDISGVDDVDTMVSPTKMSIHTHDEVSVVPKYTVLDDRTNSTVNTYVEDNLLNVQSRTACIIIGVKDGGYTELSAVSSSVSENETKTNSYNANEYETVIIALSGDGDLDGRVSSADSNMVNRSLVSSSLFAYKPLTDLQKILLDVNGDGKISLADSNIIGRSLVSPSLPMYREMRW